MTSRRESHDHIGFSMSIPGIFTALTVPGCGSVCPETHVDPTIYLSTRYPIMPIANSSSISSITRRYGYQNPGTFKCRGLSTKSERITSRQRGHPEGKV